MPQFHFTGGAAPPDEQLYSDIQQLNPLTDKQLAELVDLVIGVLTEQVADLLASLDAYAEKHGIAPTALKSVVKGLFFVCDSSFFSFVFLLFFFMSTFFGSFDSSSERHCAPT